MQTRPQNNTKYLKYYLSATDIACEIQVGRGWNQTVQRRMTGCEFMMWVHDVSSWWIAIPESVSVRDLGIYMRWILPDAYSQFGNKMQTDRWMDYLMFQNKRKRNIDGSLESIHHQLLGLLLPNMVTTQYKVNEGTWSNPTRIHIENCLDTTYQLLGKT